MTSRLRITFRILLALYLLAIIVLCFGHFKSSPDIPKMLFGLPIDKVVHFCMFLPFPVLVFLAVDKYTTKAWHSVLFAVGLFVVGCAIAVATELGQGLTTWRSADPKDFWADATALAVSSLAVFIIDISKQHK